MKCSGSYAIGSSALLLVIFSQALFPAWAASYAPGVKAGDYVKYTDITVAWSSNDPAQTKPQGVKDFEQTAYFRADIQSVSSNDVTVKTIQNFKNGTADKVQTLTGNVDTGTGNLTQMGGYPFVVAAGLGQGGKLTNSAGAPTFNQTVTGRSYAGAARDVNVLNITLSSGSDFTKIAWYWDKSTGVPVEFSVRFSFSSGSTGQYTTMQSVGLKATETNLWSPTILGIPQLWFYGIIAAVVAIVVIAAVVMMMRTRKPATLPTTTPASPATPTS